MITDSAGLLCRYISILGEILVFLGLYIYYLVTRENSFAASNVDVEKNQKVISTGTYAIIRHPMYAGALIYILGTPLALGTWWSLFLVPIFFLGFALRALNEEKMLANDLTGYAEYEKKVRWRLIPGIF
ncbi:MAG TPA: isoprenylcysteine carboxylmethyltransferase family protein [Patescibacteria group bacterium]|nr:isoprenylcysteine carboxylmethyltransferase family protein [Patescibacteria group bacterium]